MSKLSTEHNATLRIHQFYRSLQKYVYLAVRFVLPISLTHLIEYTGPFPAPEAALDVPDSAIGTGYSESKWVSERVLQVIASMSGLRPLVIRCGQMTGGRSGAWNNHEWFPSLVKSSVALRMFPAVEGVRCFFPI